MSYITSYKKTQEINHNLFLLLKFRPSLQRSKTTREEIEFDSHSSRKEVEVQIQYANSLYSNFIDHTQNYMEDINKFELRN